MSARATCIEPRAIGYRELKRIEARIIERINTEVPSRAEPGQVAMS